MKCYFFSEENKENSIFVSKDDLYIFEDECPETVLAKANEFIEKYEIRKSKVLECDATSDNGIDYRGKEEHSYEISFESLVFDGKSFVGVYLDEPQRILCFDGESQKRVCVVTQEKFVAGWGDVTEECTYRLAEKNKK